MQELIAAQRATVDRHARHVQRALAATEFPQARLLAPVLARAGTPTSRRVAFQSDANLSKGDDVGHSNSGSSTANDTDSTDGLAIALYVSLCGRQACKLELLYSTLNMDKQTLAASGMQATRECVPDIVVSEALDFRPSMDDLSTLVEHWVSAARGKEADVETGQCVQELVLQVHSLLRIHYRQQVENFASQRIAFELSSLEHIAGLDCGVFPNPDDGTMSVVFDTPVNASIGAEPTDSSISSRLIVEYVFQSHTVDGVSEQHLARAERSVWLPESWIAKQQHFKLPPFSVDTNVIAYIPQLEEALVSGLTVVHSGVARRKAALQALVSAFPQQVLEYDAEQYTHISIYLEASVSPSKFLMTRGLPMSPGNKPDVAIAVMRVTMTEEFPTEAPRISLTSALHVRPDGNSETTTVRWGTWGYSTRWRAEELAKKLRSLALDELPSFWSKLPPIGLDLKGNA